MTWVDLSIYQYNVSKFNFRTYAIYMQESIQPFYSTPDYAYLDFIKMLSFSME